MNHAFEIITNLQYSLKAAECRIRQFESGDLYRELKELHAKDARNYERTIRDLEKKLADANRQIVQNREMWFEVFEDIEKAHKAEIGKLERALGEMEKRALRAEKQRDDALDRAAEFRRQYYDTASLLEDEKGKNLKLTAQLNRDFENSSIPSSKSKGIKKIPNNREKSGRRPGAQPGHKAHGRKHQTPTTVIRLAPPAEVTGDPDFKKTGKEKVKQLVSIRLLLETTEYHADVYYNSKTNEYACADFPEGVVDDVNYDGSVKAFLYLLNNECSTSIDKTQRFLCDLTGGKLKISKGMINKLCRTFSEKSREELTETYKSMLLCPVMHTDCTNAKANGKQAYVYICAIPGGDALYFAREKKGHEGVKGTVTENYQGILVHDHESTFYQYGSKHQECLAHVLRYLKDSIDNEPDRTWNHRMHKLLQEMIHYRNGIPDGAATDPDKVEAFENLYDEILEKARDEYEKVPPGDYYRDGYNLFKRMKAYKGNHLLFLHDVRVPDTNNLSERLLRVYKRKQTQAVSFRSFDSIEYLCNGMSMLHLMRQKDDMNVFDRVAVIFNSGK